MTQGDSTEGARDPRPLRAPGATKEALPFLRSTLTLIGTPEGHAGLQTGVYPTEVAEEWLHLLAGQLALVRDPGVDTAGHQEALPGILHARQATSIRDIRTGQGCPGIRFREW